MSCTSVMRVSTPRLMHSESKFRKSGERLSAGKQLLSSADGCDDIYRMTHITNKKNILRNFQKSFEVAKGIQNTKDLVLERMSENLHRLREVSALASSELSTDADRQLLDTETQAVKANLGSVAKYATYDHKGLLGSDSVAMRYNTTSQTIHELGKLDVSSLKGVIAGDVQTIGNAAAMQQLTSSGTLANELHVLSAKQEAQSVGLEAIETLLIEEIGNLEHSESSLKDVNMAQEATQIARMHLSIDSIQAILTQANKLHLKEMDLVNI